MPAPIKYPQELRDRAVRLVLEAREQEEGLSLNKAVHRIGRRVGVNPDTLRTWAKQAEIDAAVGRASLRRRSRRSKSCAVRLTS